MQEEITLHDIVYPIWKGKKQIMFIAALAIFVALIVNYLVVKPTFSTSSIIEVNLKSDESNILASNEDKLIMSIIEQVKNFKDDKLLNESLQLSTKFNKQNVLIESVPDTNLIKVSVTGSNKDNIVKVADFVAYQIGMKVEISYRSSRIMSAKNSIVKLAGDIKSAQSQIDDLNKQLASIPEKVKTNKSLAENPYLQSVVSDSTKGFNKNLNSLSLSSEEINPLYTELKVKLAEATMNLQKLSTDKQNFEKSIEENTSDIKTLSENDTKQNVDQINKIVGYKANILTAKTPDSPIDSQNVLKTLLVGLIAVFVSCMIFYFQYFWKKAKETKNKSY